MLGYVFIRVAKAKGKYPPERLRLNGCGAWWNLEDRLVTTLPRSKEHRCGNGVPAEL